MSMIRSVRFQAALRRSYASTPQSSPDVAQYADKVQKGAQSALAAAQKAAGPTGDKVVRHASSESLASSPNRTASSGLLSAQACLLAHRRPLAAVQQNDPDRPRPTDARHQ